VTAGLISELWLIGIGTGSLGHLTQEGRDALRAASVVLVPHKGRDKSQLADLRYGLLDQTGRAAQIIPFDYPERDPSLPYATRVERWHDEIAARWQAAVAAHDVIGPTALLVWGDPALYDSTLRIAERLSPKPRLRVVPGITAIQALTAAHAIPLNTIGGNVLITTGRRLHTEGWPDNAESVVVMLDGATRFQTLRGQALYIWWGAYLGADEQMLIAGPLDRVADQIVARRAEARAKYGWIMDSYLLRKGEADLVSPPTLG